MAKYYPPRIEEKIPAFSDKLVINFLHNPGTVVTDTKGLALLITNTWNTKVIIDKFIPWNSYNVSKEKKIEVNFTEEEKSKLTISNFYKVQLAYVSSDTNETGYYSNSGIVKYTTTPNVTLTQALSKLYFQASFSQERGSDITEKLQSSEFQLVNAAGNILASSGKIIHNTLNDVGLEQIEQYEFDYNYQGEEIYCHFKYTTINGLAGKVVILVEMNARPMRLMRMAIDPRDANYGEIIPTVSLEKGSVILRVEGRSNLSDLTFSREKVGTLRIETLGSSTSGYIEDNTVEFGADYVYSYTANEGSIKKETSNIAVYFEDAFLTDGEKNLCIKYNPQVKNFKEVILETKVDTIGSKYPYFYRNGNVRYKEFSIGGLISYIMNSDWMVDAGTREATPTNNITSQSFATNLDDKNIKRELDFKLSVLEWLNNGKPKLFRSPTEGNYLIRLTNVSLTPEDKLGRMLHSFNATAYEINSADLTTLKKYGIIGNEVNDAT